MIPFFSFHFQTDESGEHAGDKRDSEIDKNTFRYLPHGNINHSTFNTEPFRQYGDKYPGINREEKDLKNGVKGYEPGAILGVTIGKIVPDNDHGNAAGKTDKDKPYHVFMLIGEKSDGQAEHKNWTDDPVLNQRKSKNLAVSKHLVQFFILYLGQRRIHHENQTESNRYICGAYLKRIDNIFNAAEKIAPHDPHKHGQKNP